MHDRPIFARHPALASALEFTLLGKFPTPVDNAPELAAETQAAGFSIKRDDQSATLYGGNKVRKLEFLLADAKAQGCTTVFTYGGLGSNHALATAIFCRELGLQCAAILTPEPFTDSVRRTLNYHVKLGTYIKIANDYSGIMEAGEHMRARFGASECYEVPFGGSAWRGVVGFVNAVFELAAQIEQQQLPEPDVIYIACGTTGSIAGLSLGLQLAGLKTRVEGVQVTPDSMQPEKLTQRLFDETSRELHARSNDIPLLDDPFKNLRIRNDQLGEGYAMPTDAARDAANRMQAAAGFPVSLTYTAKALAALFADAQAGLLKGQQVMFWNTYNSRAYPDVSDADWHMLPDELHTYFR